MKISNLPKSKKWFLFLATLIMVIVSLFMVLNISDNQNDNSYVVTVNSEPVTVREFKQILNKNIATVYGYFNKKYHVDDNPKFWTDSYGGEIPLNVIREKSINDCVRIKVQQILAKQKGIMADISYNAFLQRLEKENKKRAEDVKNNRAIFGPIKFEEQGYYDVVFLDMVEELKGKIHEELSVTDAKLERRYEDDKEKLYKKVDSVKIQKISISYFDGDESENRSMRQEAQTKIEEIKAKLNTNTDGNFDIVGKLYSDDKSLKIEYGEQIFDESTVRNDVFNPILKDEAMKLSQGQISKIFEDKKENLFYIIKCIDKGVFGFKPFSEVKESVKSDYVKDEYQKMIDRLVQEAKIKINKGIYEKISVRN